MWNKVQLRQEFRDNHCKLLDLYEIYHRDYEDDEYVLLFGFQG